VKSEDRELIIPVTTFQVTQPRWPRYIDVTDGHSLQLQHCTLHYTQHANVHCDVTTENSTSNSNTIPITVYVYS